MIEKQQIKKIIRKDGSLNTRSSFLKEYSPEELFNMYYSDIENKCKICSKNTKFLSFKNGYDKACSRECRKQLKSLEYVPDSDKIVDLLTLKNFIKNTYSNGNNTNRLNVSYFINNNYIKELNTIHSLGYDINNLKVQNIYDILHGEIQYRKCEKCGKETSFISFSKGYRKYCSNECSKRAHMTEPEVIEVKEKFIDNNQFDINAMTKEYNVSHSYAIKFKASNNIDVPNKRSKYSFGERLLFEYYKNIKCVKSNDRTLIYPYEIDVIIDNICIEYDGILFHSNGTSFPGMCGRRFKDELIPDDYELLTIFENEFLDETKRNIWFSIINNKLNLNKNKLFARKCTIKEVNSETAKIFCENNHLQGYAKSSIKIGLYHNEELVSLMTFSKSRFNKNIEYELIRFCSKINTTVSGGAGKLLKYFENTYNPKSLISYANKRWSQGKIYSKLGFEFIEDTKDNYFYFKPNENILYSRNMFQKHKLKEKLDSFNIELSEKQNMFNNGYRQIFDYGNKKYIKYY